MKVLCPTCKLETRLVEYYGFMKKPEYECTARQRVTTLGRNKVVDGVKIWITPCDPRQPRK